MLTRPCPYKPPAKNSLLVVVVQMNLDHYVLLGLTFSISGPTLFNGLLDAIQVRCNEKWFHTACSLLHRFLDFLDVQGRIIVHPSIKPPKIMKVGRC